MVLKGTMAVCGLRVAMVSRETGQEERGGAFQSDRGGIFELTGITEVRI